MLGTNFQTLGHCEKIFSKFLFLDKNKYPPNADLNNEKNDFINLYNDVMNSSTIYDRKLFKNEIKKFLIIIHIYFHNTIIYYQIS